MSSRLRIHKSKIHTLEKLLLHYARKSQVAFQEDRASLPLIRKSETGRRLLQNTELLICCQDSKLPVYLWSSLYQQQQQPRLLDSEFQEGPSAFKSINSCLRHPLLDATSSNAALGALEGARLPAIKVCCFEVRAP
ncbi:hypothetical protein E2320_015603 [Naja naja]|nr:hypothetical protein E2320_015603 [Naja naja]